jgi:hypothetical protein
MGSHEKTIIDPWIGRSARVVRRRVALTIGLIIAPVIAAALVILLFGASPTRVAFVIGVVTGVFAGLGVAALLAELQTPSFSSTVSTGRDNDWWQCRWIHVEVKNEAMDLFGGGAAVDCRGEIRVAGRTGEPVFAKWAEHLLPGPPALWKGVVPWSRKLEMGPLDAMMAIESQKTTIYPSKSKRLDIAFWHLDGKGGAYWADHKAYLTEDWMPPDFRIQPGQYHIEVVIWYRDRQASSGEFAVTCDPLGSLSIIQT